MTVTLICKTYLDYSIRPQLSPGVDSEAAFKDCVIKSHCLILFTFHFNSGVHYDVIHRLSNSDINYQTSIYQLLNNTRFPYHSGWSAISAPIILLQRT